LQVDFIYGSGYGRLVGFLRGVVQLGLSERERFQQIKKNKIAMVAPQPLLLRQHQKKRAKPSQARPSKFLVLLSVSHRQQDPHRAFSGGELS
jgi:hypothetical protein